MAAYIQVPKNIFNSFSYINFVYKKMVETIFKSIAFYTFIIGLNNHLYSQKKSIKKVSIDLLQL